MNKLESLSLSGFKSIRELENLKFGSLNVLIGENGAGKSNLISFFKLLNFAMTGALREYVARSGYSQALLHFGPKRTPIMSAHVDFLTDKGTNSYDCRMAHAAGDGLIFTEETVRFTRTGRNPPLPIDLGVGHQESALSDPKKTTDATARAVRFLLSSTRVYQFHDTSPDSPLRSKWRIDDNRYLFDHGGNIAPMLYWLQESKPEIFDLIENTIRQAAPFFNGFALEPDRLNPNVIDLRWREIGNQTEMEPHQLSDGTLRFIALVTLLSLQAPDLPPIVIIDEPELGLHPASIGILVDLLRAASASSQIIVSTQSVTLVNQLSSDELIVVDREDGQSVFRRLDPEPLQIWLDDYALGDLWMKNLIGGRP